MVRNANGCSSRRSRRNNREKNIEKKLIIIPGTLAKISAAIIRILPKRWITHIYGLSDQAG